MDFKKLSKIADAVEISSSEEFIHELENLLPDYQVIKSRSELGCVYVLKKIFNASDEEIQELCDSMDVEIREALSGIPDLKIGKVDVKGFTATYKTIGSKIEYPALKKIQQEKINATLDKESKEDFYKALCDLFDAAGVKAPKESVVNMWNNKPAAQYVPLSEEDNTKLMEHNGEFAINILPLQYGSGDDQKYAGLTTFTF